MPRKPTGQLIQQKSGEFVARHIAVVNGSRRHVSSRLGTTDRDEAERRLAELVATIPAAEGGHPAREWKPPAWLITSGVEQSEPQATIDGPFSVKGGMADDVTLTVPLRDGVMGQLVAIVDGSELYRDTMATGAAGGFYARYADRPEAFVHLEDATRLDAVDSMRTNDGGVISSAVLWAGGRSVSAYCEEHAATMRCVGLASPAAGKMRWEITYAGTEHCVRVDVLVGSSGGAMRLFSKKMRELDETLARLGGRKRRHYTRGRMHADEPASITRRPVCMGGCERPLASSAGCGLGVFCSEHCMRAYLRAPGIAVDGGTIEYDDAVLLFGAPALELMLIASLEEWRARGAGSPWTPKLDQASVSAAIERAEKIALALTGKTKRRKPAHQAAE